LFPWIVEPKPEELGISVNSNILPKLFRFTANGINAPDPNHPYSLRSTRTTWAGRRLPKIGTTDKTPETNLMELRRNGARVILFSLGGMTYSEMRSAYEITRDDKREIFFGSTYVYNPTQFIEVLKTLHDPEAISNCSPMFGLKINQAAPILDALPDPVDDKNNEKRGLFSRKK
jgi:syntaxin-binding protein 1